MKFVMNWHHHLENGDSLLIIQESLAVTHEPLHETTIVQEMKEQVNHLSFISCKPHYLLHLSLISCKLIIVAGHSGKFIDDTRDCAGDEGAGASPLLHLL